MTRPNALFVLTSILTLSLVSCFGGHGGNGGGNGGGGNGSLPNVGGINVSPFPAVVAVGGTLQFTATPHDNGGNVVNGLTVTWSSSATNVATINSSGLATGVGTGITQISASVNNGTVAFSVTLKVNPALAMTSMPLPLGANGIPYITTGLTNSGVHSGGVGPFVWSLANGTVLPAGLTMAANGSVSGTPTVAGNTNFTLQITDSETPPVQKQVNLSIVVVDPVNSPCSVVTGGNEAILNGSYAFLLQGFQGGTANGTPVAMAGSFTADGTGKITTGAEDLNVAAGPQALTINLGSYVVSATGQGCVQLKYSNNTSAAFHFTLSLALNGSKVATHGRISEFDAYLGSQGGTASKFATGVLLFQDTTQFSLTAPASQFAFGQDGFDPAGGHFAIAGSFSYASGNITSLSEDVDDAGATQTIPGLSGSVTLSSGTTGRFTVSINSGSSHEAGYIVNKNELFLVSTDPFNASPIYSGRAIVTMGPYSATSLSGNYIYHVTGVDKQGDGNPCAASMPCSGTQLGVVTANPGAKTLTGTEFTSQAGAAQSGPVNNTYAVNTTTGRTPLSGGGGAQPVLYLATPQTGTDATEPVSAFIVGTDPSAIFGFAEVQSTTGLPYVLNGNYIFATEDGGQLFSNFLVGYGSFTTTSGTATFNAARDIANIDGLFANAQAQLVLSINADGTLSNSSADGVTNSIQGTPGKVLWFPPMGNSAFIRVGEP